MYQIRNDKKNMRPSHDWLTTTFVTSTLFGKMKCRQHPWDSLQHVHLNNPLPWRQQEVETGKRLRVTRSWGHGVPNSTDKPLITMKAQEGQSKENASTPTELRAFDRRKKGSKCRTCNYKNLNSPKTHFLSPASGCRETSTRADTADVRYRALRLVPSLGLFPDLFSWPFSSELPV